MSQVREIEREPAEQPNLVDRVVGYFSPKRAFERQAYRKMSAVLDDDDGGYDGASSRRTLDDWMAKNASQDAWLGSGRREKMIARSREIERNSAFGRAIINSIVRNVVGRGIRPRPSIDAERLGITDAQASELTDFLLEQWQQFVKEAAADESGTFYDQQAMVDRRRFVDGDILTRIARTKRPGRTFETCAELVECDRILSPQRKANDPQVRDGVVKSPKGGYPIAFYVTREHPGDRYGFITGSELNFRRVPVWDGPIKVGSFSVSRVRPGQTRGEPMLAPVLKNLRHLDKYTEAELVAKRIESCLTGFIERPVGPGGGMAAYADSQQFSELEWEPGVFKSLRPGEKAHIVNPTRPGSNYEAYTYLTMRQIGAVVGAPIELILLDWSKSNYANTRAGILDAIRWFQMRQSSLVAEHSQPIRIAWMEEMFLRGMLPSFVTRFYENINLWCAAIWSPHARMWVDPQKDGKSTEIQLERGLSNIQIACDELGRDWKEVARGDIDARLWIEEEEARRRDELGLPPKQTPPPASGEQPNAGDGEEEEESGNEQPVGAGKDQEDEE